MKSWVNFTHCYSPWPPFAPLVHDPQHCTKAWCLFEDKQTNKHHNPVRDRQPKWPIRSQVQHLIINTTVSPVRWQWLVSLWTQQVHLSCSYKHNSISSELTLTCKSLNTTLVRMEESGDVPMEQHQENGDVPMEQYQTGDQSHQGSTVSFRNVEYSVQLPRKCCGGARFKDIIKSVRSV